MTICITEVMNTKQKLSFPEKEETNHFEYIAQYESNCLEQRSNLHIQFQEDWKKYSFSFSIETVFCTDVSIWGYFTRCNY